MTDTPQNQLRGEPEAEQQLIARVMQGAHGKAIEPPALAPSRFMVDTHRVTWAAIRDLHRKGQPYDAASVVSLLRQRGELTPQRKNYLTGINADPGTQDSIGHYVTLIKQAAACRAFGPLGAAISELALRQDGPDSPVKPRYQSLVRRADSVCDMASRNGHSASLKLWTPHEVLTTPAPPLNWIYDPWLGAGDVVILAGEPGLGKSWVALDLFFRLSLSRPWAGKNNLAGPQRVLYVDEENNFRLVRHRMRKLVNGMDLSIANLDPAYLAASYAMEQGINLDDPASLELLKRKLDQVRPQFIIFDSLVRIHHRDENSNAEMAALFGMIKALARNIGAGAIVIHHLGKSTKDRPSGRIAERIRGASDIIAAGDQVWGLERADDSLTMTHIKCRYDRESGPVAVSLDDVNDAEGLILNYQQEDEDVSATIHNCLAQAGAMGCQRQTLEGEVARAGFKSAPRLVTKHLGKLNATGTVRKQKDGRIVRYWLTEYAPA